MYSPSVRPANIRIEPKELGLTAAAECPFDTAAAFSGRFGIRKTANHLRHPPRSVPFSLALGNAGRGGGGRSRCSVCEVGEVTETNLGAYWPFGIVIWIG